jgi:phytoene/squalene synthetase
MSATLAAAITRAGSSQTYYTIRFLVDRSRVDDAYRAYAYFRWVDDRLDAPEPPGPNFNEEGHSPHRERERFLDRQTSLLERCLRGEPSGEINRYESMLVDLVRHAEPGDGLQTYLRHMMLVMDFDLRRRGRLVSAAELDAYTRWLAIAVTEAMHQFIGHGAAAPHDETRYLAVSGAHILHMLRDTYPDIRAGYFNVPRELLETHAIGPEDVDADAYRAWVEGRVRLARANLDAGRIYFGRVGSRRHRLAGLAYIARFEWLIDALRREDYRVRPRYDEVESLAIGLGMAWRTISSMTGLRKLSARPPIAASPRGES